MDVIRSRNLGSFVFRANCCIDLNLWDIGRQWLNGGLSAEVEQSTGKGIVRLLHLSDPGEAIGKRRSLDYGAAVLQQLQQIN